jgi:L-ascorbate metabolism protein UlaG (beta-lactamase superfamily)
LKKWINTGKKLNILSLIISSEKIDRNYIFFKKYYLDESSFIHRQINYCLNNDINFIANLGHSTFLLHYEGVKVLTDPFLSPHIFGIKRQKPALLPQLLPEVDYILISHAHYDHLDTRTLRRLHRQATIILPENTKKVLGNMYFKEKVELSHYEWKKYENFEITALPVKHNKGRSLLYPNTETSSYFFKIKDKTFYFCGDSAYFEGFKEYGEKFDIDYAFIPIGGYEPRFLLKNVHMNPQEAVQTFLDLKAKYIIPIHYATFHSIPKFVKVEAPLKHFIDEIKNKNLQDRAVIIQPNEIEMDFC